MLRLFAIRAGLFAAVAAAVHAAQLDDLVGSWGLAAAAFLIYVLSGGHYTLYLVWHTFPRDMR